MTYTHTNPTSHRAGKPFMTEYKEAFKDPTPLLMKGRRPGHSTAAMSRLLEPRGRTHPMHDRACKAGAAAVTNARALKEGNKRKVANVRWNVNAGLPTLPAKEGEKKATPPRSPPANESTQKPKPEIKPVEIRKAAMTNGTFPPASGTSLILPGMLQVTPGVYEARAAGHAPAINYQRKYDIITGYPLCPAEPSAKKADAPANVQKGTQGTVGATSCQPCYEVVNADYALAPYESRYPRTKEVVEIKRVK